MKEREGKLRYDLIPPEIIEALAEVFQYGAEKYADDDWKGAVFEHTREYKSAVLRHYEAFRGGQEFDPESGLSHLAHAMTNIAMLFWYDENRTRKSQNVLKKDGEKESFPFPVKEYPIRKQNRPEGHDNTVGLKEW